MKMKFSSVDRTRTEASTAQSNHWSSKYRYMFFLNWVFKLVSFGAFLLSRMCHPCGTKPYRTQWWLFGDLPFRRFHKKMQKMLEGFFDLAFFFVFQLILIPAVCPVWSQDSGVSLCTVNISRRQKPRCLFLCCCDTVSVVPFECHRSVCENLQQRWPV